MSFDINLMILSTHMIDKDGMSYLSIQVYINVSMLLFTRPLMMTLKSIIADIRQVQKNSNIPTMS